MFQLTFFIINLSFLCFSLRHHLFFVQPKTKYSADLFVFADYLLKIWKALFSLGNVAWIKKNQNYLNDVFMTDWYLTVLG